MNSARVYRPAAGFTLVELLVSVALMSVILGTSYACLSAGLRARETVELRSEMAQRARVALNLMTADLRAAWPLSKDIEFIGMNRTLEDAPADNLDFATHHYTPRRAQEGDFCEISYFVDRAEEGLVLWRRRDASPDEEPLAGGTREEIARGVVSLDLEYYDGLTWFEEWGDPEGRYRGQTSLLLPSNISGMPEAVRITLVLAPISNRRRGATTADHPEPPLVFQTVARLNLTPISVLSTLSASGTDSASGNQPSNP